VFTVRPSYSARNAGPRMRMNPAQITRSGEKVPTARARAASQAGRSGKSLGETTKVDTPSSRARHRPAASGLSEPTATTRTP